MPQYDMPIVANDASFERAVLQAPLPVVAVFWSPDGVPRQQLNAVLEQVAKTYQGEALVVKLDTGDAPTATAQHQVNSIPQFLFFRQGKLVARAKGMPSPRVLKPWVEYLLERGPRPASKRSAQQDTRAAPHPLVVTDADFERVVLGANVPVLVDFWAAWCGPCRMVAPSVEALAQAFAGHALMAKLDVDANPATAQRYGVMSIPTLVFFLDGQEVDRVMGAQPEHVLRAKLEQLL